MLNEKFMAMLRMTKMVTIIGLMAMNARRWRWRSWNASHWPLPPSFLSTFTAVAGFAKRSSSPPSWPHHHNYHHFQCHTRHSEYSRSWLYHDRNILGAADFDNVPYHSQRECQSLVLSWKFQLGTISNRDFWDLSCVGYDICSAIFSLFWSGNLSYRTALQEFNFEARWSMRQAQQFLTRRRSKYIQQIVFFGEIQRTKIPSKLEVAPLYAKCLLDGWMDGYPLDYYDY